MISEHVSYLLERWRFKKTPFVKKEEKIREIQDRIAVLLKLGRANALGRRQQRVRT